MLKALFINGEASAYNYCSLRQGLNLKALIKSAECFDVLNNINIVITPKIIATMEQHLFGPVWNTCLFILSQQTKIKSGIGSLNLLPALGQGNC